MRESCDGHRPAGGWPCRAGGGLWTLDLGLPDTGHWTLDIGLPGHWTLDILLWTLTFGLWTFGHHGFWAHPMDPWDMEPHTPVGVKYRSWKRIPQRELWALGHPADPSSLGGVGTSSREESALTYVGIFCFPWVTSAVGAGPTSRPFVLRDG